MAEMDADTAADADVGAGTGIADDADDVEVIDAGWGRNMPPGGRIPEACVRVREPCMAEIRRPLAGGRAVTRGQGRQ